MKHPDVAGKILVIFLLIIFVPAKYSEPLVIDKLENSHYISAIEIIIYDDPKLVEAIIEARKKSGDLNAVGKMAEVGGFFENILISICFLFIMLMFMQIPKILFARFANEINSPPASILSKITNIFPKRYSKALEQEISDMRLEYYEALSEKNIWRAKCIVAFYYIGLSWSVVMWISDKAKKVIGIIPKKD